MPKIAIYGRGWLGTIIHQYIPDSISLGRGDDLSTQEFDVLINAAAKTNIDWCEKNKLETFESNVSLAVKLAELCKARNKKYVFISSACIFSSKNRKDVKTEDSIPNPKCFYTETKVMAEKLIQEILPSTLIVRPRLPLSEVPHPRNTVNKLLSYDKINNSQESVTVVEDMLPVLAQLIETNAAGIYHLANAGTISPAQIVKKFGHKFTIVSKAEQDKRLLAENRAVRVTTYVGSNKIPLLPDIRSRINSLVEKYTSHGRVENVN